MNTTENTSAAAGNQNQKTALVTGVSSGMGLHAALELIERGVRVHGTVRREADGAQLAAAGGTVHVLDVTDHEAARAVLNDVAAEDGLDILINNAGRGAVGTAEELPMEIIREQMDTNFFSAVNLTQAAMTVMREQHEATGRTGTILTVTSVGGVIGQPFNDSYCASKFAVEGFMQSLAPVAAGVGVRVGVFEPAAVATKFVDNVERAGRSQAAYEQMWERYAARTGPVFAAAQSSESAGAAMAAAALAEDSAWKPRWQSSEAATGFVSVSLADLDGTRVTGATSAWIQAPAEEA